jgi:hypothetical protein
MVQEDFERLHKFLLETEGLTEVMLEQYFLYEIWDGLRNLAEEYRERPFFMDWHLKKEPSLFHCNFERVDEDRFPSVRSDRYHKIVSQRVSAHKRRQERDDKG